MSTRDKFRHFKSALMKALICSSVLVFFVPLALIFIYLGQHGLSGLGLELLTSLPKPAFEGGGGIVHALVGTSIMVGLSALISIPLGVTLGVYLGEYPHTKLAKTVHQVTDILNGTPSIVFGIIVYLGLVQSMKGFSALAGALALSLVITPFIIRASEEIIKAVPQEIRHAAWGLGLSKSITILYIVLRECRAKLLTASLLAIARSSGETAPLLFTAFGNLYLSYELTGPMASLPVLIYNYASSPYPHWHNIAWSASLVLICFVLLITILSKKLIKDPHA